jgi:glutamyl-tRNA reductase
MICAKIAQKSDEKKHLLEIWGLNYKSAPIEIREKFIVDDVSPIENAKELVALSTCNRSELITLSESSETVKAWMTKRIPGDIEKYTYHYSDKAAVAHLLRVASGLDSMVLGEPQILGQMKGAYARALAQGQIGPQLGHLFPFVFSVAKKIRSQTGISANSLSVAYTAVSLAKSIFTDLRKATVLLIGAGETIQLVAQHLYDIPVQNIIVANRTVEKSKTLADKISAKAIRIAEIPEVLPEADIVISSTASQLPLIGKGLLERVVKQRKHKPIFMVDLAMPRDIEPEAGQLDDVYLYNLDDLQKVVQENLANRERAAEQAEGIIEIEVNHFLRWQASLESVPTICAYREKMQQLRDSEVEKALKSLQQGKTAEDVVQRLGRDLTNKLMHAPTVEMRRASYEGQSTFLEWVKELFQLRGS